MRIDRPQVVVNVAMTADGKIDSIARQGALISSSADAARVDRLRAEVDAVLVGGRTLLDGDPRLTVKSAALRAERIARGLPENPAKVGIVSEASVRPGSRFLTAGPARRLIFTTRRSTSEQIAALRGAGAEVFVEGETRVDLAAALKALRRLGVGRLLVEGGATLIADTTEITSEGAIIGPLWVTGEIPVERSDGRAMETRSRVTLCNCGHSGSKPLCDGAHRSQPRPRGA